MQALTMNAPYRATNHPAFSGTVTDKAETLCKLIARGMGEGDDAIFDYDYEGRVEPIEFEARDGFWPWTSGGFEVCLPAALSHHWGTGCAPAAIQPIIDRGSEIIADEWAGHYPERPDFMTCITANPGDTGYEWQSEAEEWESESWLSDTDCYFWKARVIFYAPDDMQNETGEPEIYVDAYLNTDLNYGRDSIPWLRAYPGGKSDQTHGDFKRTIPLRVFEALTESEIEALAAMAVASL